MTPNVGNIDRIARIVVGLLLLSLVLLLSGSARWFGLLGLVPIATALVGWCPAYTLFGINTCAAGKAGA